MIHGMNASYEVFEDACVPKPEPPPQPNKPVSFEVYSEVVGQLQERIQILKTRLKQEQDRMSDDARVLMLQEMLAYEKKENQRLR